MKKFALLAALVLVGCGDSTPKCGDKEVIDLAKQIVTGNYFGGMLPYKFFEATVSNIRTSDYNKDIGLNTCKATFTGKFGPAATGNDPSVWSDVQKEIVYTVQINSENQVAVEARW